MFSSLDILVCILFMLYIVNITRVNTQLCKLIKDRMLNLQRCTRFFMEKQGFSRFDEAKCNFLNVTFYFFVKTKQRNIRDK